MDKEIQALEDNKTWIITDLPPGKRATGSKWAYKVKYLPDGRVERCKARLVAKGFYQIEGVDYTDSFASVAKLVSIRILLSIAVARGWEIQQLDIDNVFLLVTLHEEVYM